MQYKKAVQLCDKVLKKQSELQSGRALKALALSRLQKMDEALVLVEQLVTEQPSDEGTLQAMTMYFRESGQSKLHNVWWYVYVSLQHKTEHYVHTHMRTHSHIEFVGCDNACTFSLDNCSCTALNIHILLFCVCIIVLGSQLLSVCTIDTAMVALVAL